MKKKTVIVVAVLALFAWIGYNENKSEEIKVKPVNYPSNQYNQFNQFNQFDTGFNSLDNNTTLNDRPSVPELCPSCYGSTSCSICNGKGWNVGYNGEDYSCTACDDYSGGINDNGQPYGNGKCSTCHGTGFY